ERRHRADDVPLIFFPKSWPLEFDDVAGRKLLFAYSPTLQLARIKHGVDRSDLDRHVWGPLAVGDLDGHLGDSGSARVIVTDVSAHNSLADLPACDSVDGDLRRLDNEGQDVDGFEKLA